MNALRYKMSQLLEGYSLNRGGIISNAGKFEGEPQETLYYYDCMLDGCGPIMEVTDEESAYFDIPAGKWVYVAESDAGFVSLEYFDTEVDAENYQMEVEGLEE